MAATKSPSFCHRSGHFDSIEFPTGEPGKSPIRDRTIIGTSIDAFPWSIPPGYLGQPFKESAAYGTTSEVRRFSQLRRRWTPALIKRHRNTRHSFKVMMFLLAASLAGGSANWYGRFRCWMRRNMPCGHARGLGQLLASKSFLKMRSSAGLWPWGLDQKPPTVE